MSADHALEQAGVRGVLQPAVFLIADAERVYQGELARPAGRREPFAEGLQEGVRDAVPGSRSADSDGAAVFDSSDRFGCGDNGFIEHLGHRKTPNLSTGPAAAPVLPCGPSMPKRSFDEIEIGETHETPGITITDWHVMPFAGLSMDFFELHTSDEFAKQTEFGRRVAHGLLGLAVTDGLKNRSEFQVRAMASLHWSWDFVGPIFVGDTVKATLRVADKRASKSKPDRGIVTLELELINQRGEVVQKGKNLLMVERS